MATFTLATMDSVVVGRSARMRAVFEFLRVIGNSDSTVLVTGESGTGKEVAATLVHQTSRRKHHPFVAVSCALFSEMLIESELFGHERGAFTGAIKDRPGRFELASLDDRIRELEANLIGWALRVSDGNKSRAAELLQIKRSTLGDRINRCGLGKAEPLAAPEETASPAVATA